MKRRILSEKKCVAILFVLVLILFTLAENDARKIEKMDSGEIPVVAQRPSEYAPVAAGNSLASDLRVQ